MRMDTLPTLSDAYLHPSEMVLYGTPPTTFGAVDSAFGF